MGRRHLEEHFTGVDLKFIDAKFDPAIKGVVLGDDKTPKILYDAKIAILCLIEVDKMKHTEAEEYLKKNYISGQNSIMWFFEENNPVTEKYLLNRHMMWFASGEIVKREKLLNYYTAVAIDSLIEFGFLKQIYE